MRDNVGVQQDKCREGQQAQGKQARINKGPAQKAHVPGSSFLIPGILPGYPASGSPVRAPPPMRRPNIYRHRVVQPLSHPLKKSRILFGGQPISIGFQPKVYGRSV